MYADTLPFIDKTSVISTSSHGSLLLFIIYYFFSESQRCWSQTKLVIRASADDFASNRIVERDIIEEMYSTINQTLFGDRLSIIDHPNNTGEWTKCNCEFYQLEAIVF